MKKKSYPKEGIPIKNGKGKELGRLIGNRLVKHVSYRRHLLLFPRGWAFDKLVLEIAEKAGVTEVDVIDDDSGRTYTAPLSCFRTFGEFVDRGYGKQICLPLEHWTITN